MHLCFLSLLFAVSPLVGRAEEFNAERLTAALDSEFGPWDSTRLLMPEENFGIKWKVTNEDLTILLSSSMTAMGWLGFGIGEPTSGSMLGADVVVATFDPENDSVQVSDRHVPWTAYPLIEGATPFPVMDKQQDWIYMGANQTEDGNAVVMKRKIDTGDPQDRIVDLVQSSAVIFAYGWGQSVGYHGNNRGTTGLHFGSGGSDSETYQPPPDADSFIDFRMPNITLSSYDDTDIYVLYSQDVGEIDDIVAIDFDILTQTPSWKHHTVVYNCSAVDLESEWAIYREPQFFAGGTPTLDCAPIFGWALGGTPLELPREAGLRGSRYLLVETHYNLPVNGTDSAGNPTFAGVGTVDSSGFRMYTSSKKRSFKAQALTLSNVDIEDSRIANEVAMVHYEVECDASCTRKNAKPFQVYGSFLHMHAYGRQIWVAHYDADYKFKGVVAQTQYWNFRFQKTFPATAVIEPGDSLRLHCVFDTSKASIGPVWGQRSNEEMCVAFLYYYSDGPSGVQECGGFPTLELEGLLWCDGDLLFNGLDVKRSSNNALPCTDMPNGEFPLPNAFEIGSPYPNGTPTTECVAGLEARSIGSIVLGCVIGCSVVLFLAFFDSWQQIGTYLSKPVAPPVGNGGSDITVISNENRGSIATVNPLAAAAKKFAAENPFPTKLMMERFEEHVLLDPSRLLFAWLDAETNVVNSFTRLELWNQSRDLAFYLQTHVNVRKGDRVMIVYPFGIEFIVGFVALLRIGAIVVSVFPPNPRKLETDILKFAHFVQDSGAKVALTTRIYKRIVKMNKRKTWPRGLKWVASDKKLPPAPDSFQDSIPQADSVALVQYTSGSTSDPVSLAPCCVKMDVLIGVISLTGLSF